MNESTAIAQLEILERNKRTFDRPDPILDTLVRMQSERLKDAAMMLGHEWNGMFSGAHLLLVTKAFYLAKTADEKMQRNAD